MFKERTEQKNTRCSNSKPAIPSWSFFNSKASEITWSAMGGNKVEINFGYAATSLPYHIILANDGHEKVGIGTVAGWFGGYWKIRTISGCKAGDWSPVYHF